MAAAASGITCCSLAPSNQSFILAATPSSPHLLPVRPTASTHNSSALSIDYMSHLQKHSPLLQARNSKFQPLMTKATGQNQNTKRNSIVCADCDGNGAVQCSQCKGTGVNSVDHFNGQFKAGALCWLCRGKREILCGSCNGAGFLGGFMSTFDE